GYGMSVPEAHHDDFAGMDLRGKVVVYISGGPATIAGPLRAHAQSARERNLALQPAGVIRSVSPPKPEGPDIPWERASLARFQVSMSLAEPAGTSTQTKKVGVIFNPAHAAKLFAGSGHDPAELLAQAADGKPLPRFALPVSLRARATVEHS